jgi:predicted  nucleic acid-binding Zn-ribbon protein
MTSHTRISLKELQQLDQEIAAVRSAAEDFEPLLEEIDGPVLRLEQDVKGLDKRLTQIRVEENRIELTIEERGVRAAKLQERMEAVRNVREEAAVHAELEMVRRALESEEQEALSLLDQIKRLEERHEEQDEAYREALAEVGPRRAELVEEQESAGDKLESLKAARDAFAAGIDPGERRIYDSIMAGARDVALAELTQDGACGNCFNMVPLQIQNRIRHSDAMIRCEGCGVILTPESAEGLAKAKEEGERIERALKESTDERDLERVAVSEAAVLEESEEEVAEAVAEKPEPAPEEPGVGGVFDAFSDAPIIEEASAEDPADEPAVEDPGGVAVADVASDEAPAEEPTLKAAREGGTGDEPSVEDVEVQEDTETDAIVEDVPADEPTAEEAEEQEPTVEEAEEQEPTADA